MLLSLLIVMILLIGIINVVYLINFQDQAYETIDFVEENYLRMRLPGEAGGPMGMGGPGAMNGTGQLPEEDDWEDRDDEDFEDHLFSGFRRDGSALTPDTRYETSFFVVSLDADGSVTEMDHSYIASVSEEDIDAYAKEILASGKEQGQDRCRELLSAAASVPFAPIDLHPCRFSVYGSCLCPGMAHEPQDHEAGRGEHPEAASVYHRCRARTENSYYHY